MEGARRTRRISAITSGTVSKRRFTSPFRACRSSCADGSLPGSTRGGGSAGAGRDPEEQPGAELRDEHARFGARRDALALFRELHDVILLEPEQAELLADAAEPPAHDGRQAEQRPLRGRVADCSVRACHRRSPRAHVAAAKGPTPTSISPASKGPPRRMPCMTTPTAT